MINITSFSYAFAVKAYDDAGYVGDVSNIAVATFRRIIPTQVCASLSCEDGEEVDEESCSCIIICEYNYQGNECQCK